MPYITSNFSLFLRRPWDRPGSPHAQQNSKAPPMRHKECCYLRRSSGERFDPLFAPIRAFWLPSLPLIPLGEALPGFPRQLAGPMPLQAEGTPSVLFQSLQKPLLEITAIVWRSNAETGSITPPPLGVSLAPLGAIYGPKKPCGKAEPRQPARSHQEPLW